MKPIALSELLGSLKSNPFVLNCKIQLGYAAGIPIVTSLNDKVCIQVPYWKCKVTGVKNKNLIYPIRYVLTFELPSLRPIAFTDLKYNDNFKNINFDNPIGLFPAKHLQNIRRDDYLELKGNLLAEYSIYANMLLAKEVYVNEHCSKLSKLLLELIDPCLLDTYKLINPNFSRMFLDIRG